MGDHNRISVSDRLNDLIRRAANGSLTRRQLLRHSAALGVTAPTLQALLATAPAGAAPAPRPTSAGPQAQADPKTLTIVLDGSPSDLDPHSAYDYRSAVATRGPYEPLIGLKGGATDQYEGLIAESWSANEDKSVWTFTIRDGVTFHDGSPCDAEAVRLSFERLLTLALGPYNTLARFVPDPAQITAPDAKTVVFNLVKPQPLFEAAMAGQYGTLVMNAKAAREQEEEGDWGHTWAQTSAEGLGTGPYQITSYEPGERVSMERYEGYWGGWDGEHFDRVEIRVVAEDATRRQLIETGEVDIVDTLTPEGLQALEQNPDVTVDKAYSTEVDYFLMTVAGPLATPVARQALCYAFPYDEVIQGVYKGYGKRAVGPVAEACRGHAPETFTYPTDLAKAKELLAQAGVAEGTTLTLMVEAGRQNDQTAVQLFQANLEQIGVGLDIQTVDLTAFTATVFGDAPVEERPQVMPWFWWPDYNDAWNHLQPQVSCDAWGSKGTNSGFYCNQRVEELMAQSRDATDEETYRTALVEVQQILTRDDPAAIYYMQRQWTTVLRKGISGFTFNPIYIGTYDFHGLSRTA